jgi:hypothetical protein
LATTASRSSSPICTGTLTHAQEWSSMGLPGAHDVDELRQLPRRYIQEARLHHREARPVRDLGVQAQRGQGRPAKAVNSWLTMRGTYPPTTLISTGATRPRRMRTVGVPSSKSCESTVSTKTRTRLLSARLRSGLMTAVSSSMSANRASMWVGLQAVVRHSVADLPEFINGLINTYGGDRADARSAHVHASEGRRLRNAES